MWPKRCRCTIWLCAGYGLQFSDITHRLLGAVGSSVHPVIIHFQKSVVRGKKNSSFAAGVFFSPLNEKNQREFREHLAGPPSKCILMAPAGWETSRNPSSCQLRNILAPDEARRCGSVPLLLRRPHGNNNEAVDARALGACWGIICTSSWTDSSTLHWMTGGRHRSAKHRDLASSTRWEGVQVPALT